MGKFIDLTGEVFGRLTVIRRVSNVKNKITWLCQCECGNHTNVSSEGLRQWHTRSCGCLAREILVNRNTIHGNAVRNNKTGTYETWRGMIARCCDPLNKRYDNYYGRGIGVCDEWHDFSVFITDMGERPKGMTLDRKDNNKGYCKENCRWATISEQANNRSNNHILTHNDKSLTLTQWSRILGVHRETIRRRLRQGWGFDRVFEYYSKKVAL